MAKSKVNIAEFMSAWQVLLLSVLGITISINAVLLYGFGTLVGSFEQAFSWGRSEQQVAITFLYGGAVIGLQLVGWLNIHFGIKRVTVASLLLMGLGYLVCTQVIGGSIWSLYIAFALLPIIGMGALAVTWTQLIALWFLENRGLALAIGLSGTGITAAITPSIMAWSVDQYNWQAPFVILALINFLMIPLVLIWFRIPGTRSEQPEHQQSSEGGREFSTHGVTFREGFTSVRFWICNLSLCLVVSAVVGMVTNTVPILRDAGFSATESASIFGFFGLSLIAGRLIVGYLLDRLWPPAVAAATLILPAIGCLIFLGGTQEYWLLALAVALFGLGAGAEFDIAAFLIAKYFGIGDYARLFGFHQGLITVASAMAPLMFAAMYDSTGAYQMLLLYCCASTIVGPLLLLFLGKVPEFSAKTA